MAIFKTIRTLFKVIILLVLLLVVGVGVGIYYIDSIAKIGIEKGASYALGVDTSVENVGISLLDGTMTIENMTLDNPKGFSFKTPHLIQLDRFDLGLQSSTLLKETIQIRQFKIDGLDINIEEGKTGNNFSKVLEYVKEKFKSDKAPGEEDKEKKEEKGKKKVKLDKIEIYNLVAHFHFSESLGKLGKIDVPIDELILENISSDGPHGDTVSQLSQKLLPIILAAIMEKAKDFPGIPPDLLKDINIDIADVGKVIGGDTEKLIQEIGGAAGKILQNLGDGDGDGEITDILKDIGNILSPKDKDETPAPEETPAPKEESKGTDEAEGILEKIGDLFK